MLSIYLVSIFMANIIGIIFAGVFCVIGTAFFLLGALAMYSQIQSQGWPSVVGVINTVNITSGQPCGNGGCSTIYYFHSTYNYSVGGSQYTGTQLSLGGSSFSSISQAAAAANEYAVGSHPNIYYNPSSPSQAVLQTGINWSYAVFGIVGLAFTAAGAFFGYRSFMQP